MKAILAKKQEEEAEARRSHVPPSKAAVADAEDPSEARTSGSVGCSRLRQLPHGLNRARLCRSRALLRDCSARSARDCVEAASWSRCGKGSCRGSSRRGQSLRLFRPRWL